MTRHPILVAALILAASTAPAWADLPITTLVSFNGTNGANPYAGLTLSSSTLYGTTKNRGVSNYGTVFSVPITGGTPTVLASFNGTNGANPQAGLTLSADGNTLYGTTYFGGASNCGTVFSVPVAGGTPTVLTSFYSFLEYAPLSDLTLSGTTLYGTTRLGGVGNSGTVFSIPVTGGTPTILASFNLNVGNNPSAGLTLSGNTLYGTAFVGQASGVGSVFSVPITGGTPTCLTVFNGTNGANPYADLTLSGNLLFGTTRSGGASGLGTIFSVPITGGTTTVLALFDGTNGQHPMAGLTLAADGNTLYGTTVEGGTSGFGTVFSIPITGGTPTVLASFNGTTGANPLGGLTLSPDGTTLFGTTQAGGASNFGTVFSITLPVPEPASLLLLSLATPALLLRRKPRKT